MLAAPAPLPLTAVLAPVAPVVCPVPVSVLVAVPPSAVPVVPPSPVVVDPVVPKLRSERLTLAEPLSVGNRAERAMSTVALASRYCASYTFTFWLLIATCCSNWSSNGSW